MKGADAHMKPIPKAGILLGVLVVIWMYIIGVTGWYKDPVLLNMFYIVILIQIAVLLWGLKRTAAMVPMQTPFINALTGSFMTVVTGFVVSLIIAAFVKAKVDDRKS